MAAILGWKRSINKPQLMDDPFELTDACFEIIMQKGFTLHPQNSCLQP